MTETEILEQNKEAWDAIADDWFGTTALPTYGELIPDENKLHLFGNVKNKVVLDLGCGSGHSLKYLGDKGASELWGLDLSTKQIENAGRYLNENNYFPKLFVSPMEMNPGLPTNYFDVVYSIYAIGWTTDIDKTLRLVASYLKKDGVFIFSWDHPLMNCVEIQDNKLVFSGSYFRQEPVSFQKGGKTLSAFHRKLSDYINPLANAGFAIECLIEETDKDALERGGESHSNYYSPIKAKKFPLSFVMKARKL